MNALLAGLGSNLIEFEVLVSFKLEGALILIHERFSLFVLVHQAEQVLEVLFRELAIFVSYARVMP